MEEEKRMAENEIENFKKTNEEYVKQIERFLDIASNIQDKDLQERIIFQMLRCDKILTDMTVKLCRKYHENKV